MTLNGLKCFSGYDKHPFFKGFPIKRLLKTYRGKGSCDRIEFTMMDSLETGEEEDMRQMAQNLDWDIEVTVEQMEEDIATDFVSIVFKRK